jgi:hypothetical protein
MRFLTVFPSAGVLLLAAGVTVTLAQGVGSSGTGGLDRRTGSGPSVGGSSIGAGSSSDDGTGAAIDGPGNLGDRGTGTGDVGGTVTEPRTNDDAPSTGAQAGAAMESNKNAPANDAPGRAESSRANGSANDTGGASTGTSVQGEDRASSGSASGTLQ